MSRRNLLIGITGSIAAKKTIDLIKLLDSNYDIKVICTYEGQNYINKEEYKNIDIYESCNILCATYPDKISDKPNKIIAYQMMGKERNGNTCPFLDTETNVRSPHGGFPCKIYENRPLACKAYPVIESNPITLDSKCEFCKEHGSTDKNLNSELESLVKIKNSMNTGSSIIWRFATGIGEDYDQDVLDSGWFLE